MSASVAGQRARSQLRFLKQAVDRLERFHAANFKREIQDFEAFFTQDDVVGVLWNVLHRRLSVDVAQWYQRVQKSSTLEALPEDPAACLAFRFASLRLIKRGKLDLRYFVSNLYPGAHLNEKLMNWKREVVHPLAADCCTLADALMERIGDQEWVDLEALFEEYLDGPFRAAAFGARAWSEADDRQHEEAEAARKAAEREARVPASAAPAPTPAASTGQALSAGCDRLEADLRASDLPPVLREDLLLDVEALRLEFSRSARRRDRIRARLAVLAEHAADACAALRVAL